uniref:NADH dehydrogenase [ubiquinone] 1 alpha subcomplex subunit 1 n=1 Tax=Laticauda laticaudata TaxID=8630 RepID=A0A8C5S5P2_LATLA
MWYEILPSAAIMYVGLIIPGISTYYIQRYMNNGENKRMIKTADDYKALLREKRVCGIGSKGLEKINID